MCSFLSSIFHSALCCPFYPRCCWVDIIANSTAVYRLNLLKAWECLNRNCNLNICHHIDLELALSKGLWNIWVAAGNKINFLSQKASKCTLRAVIVGRVPGTAPGAHTGPLFYRAHFLFGEKRKTPQQHGPGYRGLLWQIMLLYSGCCLWSRHVNSNCTTTFTCWAHGCILMRPERHSEPERALESIKSHTESSLWLSATDNPTKEFGSHLGIKETQHW